MPAPASQRMAPAKRKANARNQLGQRIGAKGSRTCEALIAATVSLLESVGLRDVTVAEVAKLAGTSPATFYVYFEGVAEVVLAALETAEQVTPEMFALLDGDFSGKAGFKRAHQLVEAYVNQWQKYRTVFRVRNLAAEEGDERFRKARLECATPLIEALEKKITSRGQSSKPQYAPLEPLAIAATLIMMLERLGAVGPLNQSDDRVGLNNLTLAAAHFVQSALAPNPKA